jgi:DNA polymerase-1
MAAKKYRFGHIQYGGTLRSIYEKLMLEVPDLPLTFNDLARADAQYLAKYPAHAEWVRRQTDLCLADPRIVTNAFGRRRILLGSDADVEREALNTPIQGTGADIVNTAMIRIYADFKKTALKARFVAQVHDQLLVECPDGEVTRVKRIMKKHMEATFHLWQRDVRFPVEMKVGKNWRDLKKA